MQKANHYKLNCGKKEVEFFESDISGKPLLKIENRAYSSDEITMDKTAIGTLCTVTTESIPDKEDLTFSVLLPPVNVESRGKPEVVVTYCINAVHKSSITGPDGVQGQIISYDVEDAQGEADLVVT